MILHHVSVGVADVERAGRFYDAVLKTLGYKRYWEIMPYAIAYGEDGCEFWVQRPHNQKAAEPGNGPHIAFKAGSIEAVQRFYKAALANGGIDDGAPGPRPDYGPDYYGAFVRDPDGNKIEAVLSPLPRVAKLKLPAKPKAKPKTKPKAKAKKAVKKAAAKPKKKAKKKARKR
jgi:catechol 2,3-dioxygenase-like lactoylglutathione lyase family enzyme